MVITRASSAQPLAAALQGIDRLNTYEAKIKSRTLLLALWPKLQFLPLVLLLKCRFQKIPWMISNGT